MRRLLVLGGAEFQIPIVQAAKQRNLWVGIVDINADAPACEYADIAYVASLKDRETILKIAKEFRPDGITVGMVDIAVPVCSYVTTELGLPGMDMETAIKVTDKYEMIKTFEKHSVSHPLYWYVERKDIDAFDEPMQFPVIVKPVDMAGSRGIYLATDKEQLRQSLQWSSKVGDRGDVLIEEYMDGVEVSVELIIKDGIPYAMQVTDKVTSGPPHFAETGHLQPSQLPEDIVTSVKKLACDAAGALGLRNSLGHAEIKVTKDGPKMIEIGARAGGDAIAEQLIELSAGISFAKVAIQIALGEEIEIPANIGNRAACIRFIPSRSGVLQKVDGIETAESIRGVEYIKITGCPGKRYFDMADNSGRIGYVIASAENGEMAQKACDAAMESIQVVYCDESGKLI